MVWLNYLKWIKVNHIKATAAKQYQCSQARSVELQFQASLHTCD